MRDLNKYWNYIPGEGINTARCGETLCLKMVSGGFIGIGENNGRARLSFWATSQRIPSSDGDGEHPAFCITEREGGPCELDLPSQYPLRLDLWVIARLRDFACSSQEEGR